MKKLLSVFLALTMVMCFCVTAMAEGGFVSSPSGNKGPEVLESTNEVVITPFGDRATLAEDERKQLEEAYESINSATNLVNLNKELEDIAKLNDLLTSDLAVSDLFNISSEKGGAQSITLKADTFKNFVALMTYVNGEWKIVKGAKLQDGKLIFTAEHFGPYAVVVNKGSTTSPQTGINEVAQNSGSSLAVYGVVMLISACGALIMWKKSKRYSA